MTTILPSAPPPRSPMSSLRFGLPRLRVPALVLAVLVLGLGAAAGARAWTGRLPGPDRPSGKQLPLTAVVGLPAGPRNPAFQISVPNQRRSVQHPTADNPTIFSALLGRPGSALLFVRIDDAGSAKESIEQVGGGVARVGDVRRVSVAGRPAYTRDLFVMEKVVHEYRFEIDGAVYGFGILSKQGDDVARDTGLAAMETFQVL